MCGLDSPGSEYRPVAGCCEHDSKTLDSIKSGEYFDQWIDCQFLTNDSVPWN